MRCCSLVSLCSVSRLPGLDRDSINCINRWNDAPLTGLTWSDLPAFELTTSYIQLAEGVHDFYHVDPSKTFVVMEYGNAPYASYGTTAGSRGAPINTVTIKAALFFTL